MNRSLAISAAILLGSNLVALVFALWFQWNTFEIVLLYWIQALIIGGFQRRKVQDMIAYARHPRQAKWFRSHGTSLMQEGMHNAFAGVYGVFWAVAGILLLIAFLNSRDLVVDPVSILLATSVFACSHWWSYRTNKPDDEQRVVDINVLLLPVLRMFLPLHVFAVVMDLDVTTTPAVTAVWMTIKTAVDVGAHIIEHSEGRRIPAASRAPR
ncbi:MAG: DUF6498-containing protein [Woeseia sp.]